MRKYILDTQLLIRAIRFHETAERIREFLSASVVYLSSVVAKELLAGARPNELRRLHRDFLEPFEDVGRVVTPTHRGWKDAGTILQKLRATGWQVTPSLANDALIAVSATEIGATLVHDNAADFRAIERHYPRLQQSRGWPMAA